MQSATSTIPAMMSDFFFIILDVDYLSRITYTVSSPARIMYLRSGWHFRTMYNSVLIVPYLSFGNGFSSPCFMEIRSVCLIVFLLVSVVFFILFVSLALLIEPYLVSQCKDTEYS